MTGQPKSGLLTAKDHWGVEWDEQAERLYRLAQEESFALGDEYIGTQHLLLAAVTVSPEFRGIEGLSRDAVLSAIIEFVGVRDPDTELLSPGGQTPRAKSAVQRAMQRAAEESRRVSCQDIWHALLADLASEAVRVFNHLGVRGRLE